MGLISVLSCGLGDQVFGVRLPAATETLVMTNVHTDSGATSLVPDGN
jgi:hypothetical protein